MSENSKTLVSSAPNMPFMRRMRQNLAGFLVRVLYGREMTITPFQSSAVAGTVIFWYFESGVRYFVMVKNPRQSPQARFVSCLGLGDNTDITSAAKETVRTLLGEVFFKSLNKGLIAVDRVAAVPTFKCEDPTSKTFIPVNSAVWAVQITPEQAQLCQPKVNDMDVVAIPEFAVLGKEVTSSHHMLYQAALKHIHGSNPLAQALGIEQLEDIFKEVTEVNTKVIH